MKAASPLTRCRANPPLVIFIRIQIFGLVFLPFPISTDLDKVSFVLNEFVLAQMSTPVLCRFSCAGDHHFGLLLLSILENVTSRKSFLWIRIEKLGDVG